MTPKQQKLIEIILENIRAKKHRKTLGEMLIEAGYSKSISTVPSLIFQSKVIQKSMKSFLDKLKEERNRILQAMSEKNLNKEQYKVLSDSLTKANHDIQMFEGKPTENIGFSLKEVLKKSNEP